MSLHGRDCPIPGGSLKCEQVPILKAGVSYFSIKQARLFLSPVDFSAIYFVAVMYAGSQTTKIARYVRALRALAAIETGGSD